MNDELTRGECIADPYFNPATGLAVSEVVPEADSAIGAHAFITSTTPQSTPSREDQRRIERYLLEQRLAPRPMESHVLGKLRVDGGGRTYAQHNGGLHRAHIDADGNVRLVTKWTKARRKAEKRARREATTRVNIPLSTPPR